MTERDKVTGRNAQQYTGRLRASQLAPKSVGPKCGLTLLSIVSHGVILEPNDQFSLAIKFF